MHDRDPHDRDPRALAPHDGRRRDADPSATAVRLRTRLDRAVRSGRIGRGLAAVAIAAGCLAVAIAVGAAADLLALRAAGPWRGIPALVCVAAAGAAAVALAAQRRRSGTRATPGLDRLGVALATEADTPRLGARISRAVEFLEDPADPGDPLVRGLRRLAVAKAAEAIDDVPRLSVPGSVARRRWIVGGLAATAAVALSAWAAPEAWRTALRGQLFGGTVSGQVHPDMPADRRGAADAPAASVAAPGDVTAAIAAARHAVQVLHAALADGLPLPDERRHRLAARARAAAGAAEAALDTLPADTPAALLPLFATGLGDVATALAGATASTATPSAGADADTGAETNTDAGAASARARLAHLAAASAAAGRLVAAVAVEARLADVSARGFAVAPGVAAAGLPAGTRAGLERLAEIAAECRQVVAADSRTLRAATEAFPHAGDDAVRRICARLDAVAVDAAAPLSGHVAANRLSRAAAIAADAARAIAAAVTALGMPPADTASADLPFGMPPGAGDDLTAAGPPQPAPLDRTRAALERAAAVVLAPLDVAASTADGGRTDGAAGPPGQTQPATGARPPSAASTAGRGSSGSATAAAAGGAAMAGPEAAGEPSAAERIWMLLPSRERPDMARQNADGPSAAYRSAIDAYYRLLLQSLTPPAAPAAARDATDRIAPPSPAP